MKRAFTMVEMLVATTIVATIIVLVMMTFHSVTSGWTNSTEYLDKLQRTDYAINQLVYALRSSYYPRKTTEGYCFFDPYDRDGSSPRDSDIIEWTKKGNSLVGSDSVVADSVHKVRVMVLEEGETEDGDDDEFTRYRFKNPIKKTGLYARAFIDPALASKSEEEETNVYFEQPVLIADGVIGFKCETVPEEPKEEEIAKSEIKDEYKDGKFPYYVIITLFMEKKDDTFLSQSEKYTIVRRVRLPIYEQAKDPK